MKTPIIDPRDFDDVVARLAMLASGRDVPSIDETPPPTWHELLFAGTRFDDLTQPDRALLTAFAQLAAGLGIHLNTLPDALRAAWLRNVVEVPIVPVLPDIVPITFAAVDETAPVVVPEGAEIRAKDDAGNDRRYLTTQPLTVHSTGVTAVRAYGAVRADNGRIADSMASWDDIGRPFAPFAIDPAPLAHHRCRFVDPILAISAAGALSQVTIAFSGLDTRLLRNARWFQSTDTGPIEIVATAPTNSTVRLEITSTCTVDIDSGDAAPWVEVSLPPTTPDLDVDALSAAFTDVSLSVRVEGLPADAAFANDGKLDLEKEAQPFGPVPKRGDAFYVRSDEAFSKPLSRLGVGLGIVPTVGESWPPGLPGPWHVTEILGLKKVPSKGYFDWSEIVAGDDLADVTWQHRVGGAWQELDSRHGALIDLSEISVTTSQPLVGFSEPSSQAGTVGRAVRAVLIGGDLGWADYQSRLADFAAKAVNQKPVSAKDLLPPEPPSITRASITYQTAAVRPHKVVSTDGWAQRQWPAVAGEPYFPFRIPVTLGSGGESCAAAIDIGLAIGDTALGGSLSLYFDVAPAKIGASNGTNEWSIETTEGRRPAVVSDGTHGLRQSGLLRVAIPVDWVRGSAESGEPDGDSRWLRLASTEPGRLGALRAVSPDTVEAAQTARPDLVDPSRSLAPGQVKGLVSAIAGIKKVTNLAGRPGRTDETPDAYLRRGSGLHRHRDRAVQVWDYEELARLAAPDAAAIRCLPHTCRNGGLRPGDVALIVIPAGAELSPTPTVALAERIETALRPHMPLTASLTILAPEYELVSIDAHAVLASGVAGFVGRQTILDRLEEWLHPTHTQPLRFGRALFASEVVTFLESLDVVDRLVRFAMTDSRGGTTELVQVDPDRGLIASSGKHAVTVEEQL